MVDIKMRNVAKGTVKTVNKSIVVIKRAKDNISTVKEKSESATNPEENNINEYTANRVQSISKGVIRKATKFGRNIKFEKAINTIKNKFPKNKIIKNKDSIKLSNLLAKKEAEKVAYETIKTTKKAVEKAQESAKKTYYSAKFIYKAMTSSIKSMKFLLIIGGTACFSVIISCLIGLLCNSVFGIFFSGEKFDSNSMTVHDVIEECNQELSDRIQSIQKSNPHDEYVLDGDVATWRDILTIYAVKQSVNEQEVVTMDDNKKKILKDIYWDMNFITSEVKEEFVIEQDANTEKLSKEVKKKVLYIKINSKTADEMITEYHFNSNQIKEYNELSSNEYASLWNNVVYGMDSGEYITWRQNDISWANIRISNTNNTLGEIGCLVTSIAILIKKSGINTTISPFNPGTFVEALNKNGGFDSNGNLQYVAVNKVVVNFKYVGNVNLREKSRAEKLSLITQYLNNGYYLTVEVKGATESNQHWVAVIGVDGNNVVMVDPATNHTDMWSAYDFSKTSQFNYFRAN